MRRVARDGRQNLKTRCEAPVRYFLLAPLLLLLVSCSSVETNSGRKDVLLELRDRLQLDHLSIACEADGIYLFTKLEEHEKALQAAESLIKDASAYAAKCYLVSGVGCYRNQAYPRAKEYLFKSIAYDREEFLAYIYLMQTLKVLNDADSRECIRGLTAVMEKQRAGYSDGKRLAFEIILTDAPPASFAEKLGAIKKTWGTPPPCSPNTHG